MMILCHGDHDWPDTGEVCCMGVAVYGPGRCTCWRPVYDLQQFPLEPGPMPQREKCCHDCAFRNGSLERSGDERMAHSGEGELDAIVHSRAEFTCHQGVRRIVRWVHPSGAVKEAGPGAYDPPIRDGVPYKANGQPSDRCAGVMAARAAIRMDE